MSNVLITAAELAAELARGSDVRVLDVRYPGPTARHTGRADFVAGHIPGSQWLDVDADLSDPHPAEGVDSRGRHPLPDPERLQQALRRVGVRRSERVVVLDGGDSLAAGRAWWLLRDGGLESVQVLDGGFAAWQRYGGEVVGGELEEAPPGDVVLTPGRLPKVEAEELLTGRHQVWDVRAAERYRGDSEPLDPVAGHIPGARNLPAGAYHRGDGRFLPAEELREVFAEVGEGAVFSCGSGITAAQAVLAMAAAGREDAVLYAGSWSGWVADPDRPVARGPEPGAMPTH